MKNFGNMFTLLQKSSPYTLTDIARMTGVSHVTAGRWKEMESIDAATLEKLCRIFKCSIVSFFDDDVVNCDYKFDYKLYDNKQVIVEDKAKEIELLKKQLEEKERFIQFLLEERKK